MQMKVGEMRQKSNILIIIWQQHCPMQATLILNVPVFKKLKRNKKNFNNVLFNSMYPKYYRLKHIRVGYKQIEIFNIVLF